MRLKKVAALAAAFFFAFTGIGFAQSYCVPAGPVTMVIADDCPYCHAALNFFARQGVRVRIEDIGTLFNAPRYGLPGVPVITVGPYQIVGFDYQRAAELEKLLCLPPD